MLEEISKLILKEKLYYGCLQEIKKEPCAKNYANSTKIYKVCNGEHSTTLHGYIRIKVSSEREKMCVMLRGMVWIVHQLILA